MKHFEDTADQSAVLNSVLTEAEETRRGELLVSVLGLRADRSVPPRYKTAWGTKTALGLFRTVERIVKDGE